MAPPTQRLGHPQRPGAKSDTSAASASPTTGSPTETRRAGTTHAPEAEAYDDVHFVCPEGGMNDVVALQQAVDEGHQPWRLSAPDVAAACTFGAPEAQVEPVGTNRFQVSQPSTGQRVIVDLAQPLGPGTVWVVTSVTPLGDAGSTPLSYTGDLGATSRGCGLGGVRSDSMAPDHAGVRRRKTFSVGIR